MRPIKSQVELSNKNLEGKNWLCRFFSVADFHLFEFIDMVYDIDKECLGSQNQVIACFCRTIHRHHSRIREFAIKGKRSLFHYFEGENFDFIFSRFFIQT